MLGAELLTETCGNAIRKVYICNANTRQLNRGDLLIFVQSATRQPVSDIGVVEEVLVSRDPLEILDFAGERTVYSLQEIAKMTQAANPALVIKFRHDRHLPKPWTNVLPGYADLVGSSPAQSIRRVRPEGVRWLRARLNASR
jgi:hypothetical protein